MPHHRSASRHAAGIAIALLLATAGCSKPAPAPQYTHQQATDLVEENLRAAAAQLRPTPQLETNRRGQAPCAGPTDTEDTNNVMVEHSYRLRGLDPAHNQQTYDQLMAYWDSTGYTVTLDDGPQPTTKSRWTTARHPNGFKMSLIQGVGGALTLSAQSPCVARPPTPSQ